MYLKSSEEEVNVAGTEGWRGAMLGEKAGEVAGAKSSQIKPFTKTDILGGSDMIWLRFYYNPSGC